MYPFILSEVDRFIIVDTARPKSCFSTLFVGVCSVPQWHYGHSSPKHFVDLFYCFYGINRMLSLFWDIVKAFLFLRASKWAKFRLECIDCVWWPELKIFWEHQIRSSNFLFLNLIFFINKEVCSEENNHTKTASENVFRLSSFEDKNAFVSLKTRVRWLALSLQVGVLSFACSHCPRLRLTRNVMLLQSQISWLQEACDIVLQRCSVASLCPDSSNVGERAVAIKAENCVPYGTKVEYI